MIKEILEKSDNNIEGAKQLISEFKQKQSLNNPNNLNLHHSNRKRRHESAFINSNSTINSADTVNTGITMPSLLNNNNINGFFNNNINKIIGNGSHNYNSVLLNPFGNNNFTNAVNNAFPERRIIKFNNKIYPFNNANISFSNLVSVNGSNSSINTSNNINLNNNLSYNNSINLNSTQNLGNNIKTSLNDNQMNQLKNDKPNYNADNFSGNIYNTNMNSNTSEVLDDQALEKLINEVGQYKTKDEIKAYLKNKITSLISKIQMFSLFFYFYK